MVVTRKKPSAPAPPTSRTTSTQALPRAVNAKPTLSTTSDTHSDSSQTSNKTVPNGVSNPRTKSKKSKPGAPPTQRERRSFLDRLFFLSFTIFAAYALWVCPSDTHHESPVCRSLATYRTHVLEPYVIPPLRAAVTHPIVVQPYEKYAKPIYQNYVQPVTPYVAAAQRRTAPYANAVFRVSKRTSLRIWNRVLKPYWTRAIVPRYNMYIQPRVNKYVSPITKRVKYYVRRAEPYVLAFAHHTSVYARESRKHAIIAYDRVKPQLLRVYKAAAPHASRAYTQVKPFLCQAFDVAQTKGKHLVSETMVVSRAALGHIGDLRRQFVDPHILRIWEKAVEKSGPSSTTKFSSVVGATSTSSSVEEIFDGDTDPEGETVESVVQPTPASIPTTASIPSPPVTPVTVDATQEPEVPDAPTSPTPSRTPEETLEKAASVAEQSAGHASSVIANLEREIKSAEAEQVPFTPTPNPVEAPEPTPIAEAAAPVVPVAQQAIVEEPVKEEENLDDFLREIGLDDEAIPEPVPEPEVVVPVHQEEDPEVKKAATAAKRADIVGRHVRWQSEIDTLVKDLETRVKREIQVIRDEALAHLGRLPSDKDGPSIDGKGTEVLHKIQNDGEKFLKGLEAYVNKLKSQTIAVDELEKEREKWDKLVDKVEDKFKDIIRNVQEEVHNWYVGIRAKEAGAVLAASSEAKSLADKAQADLGLDYAWLDDVSYHDWQKYHDLMRTSERFDQTIRSLANGTHADAPEDKLVPVLNNLDREVQDMIAGFAMRMSVLVREGDQSLNDSNAPVPEQDFEEGEGEDEDDCEEEEEEGEEEDPQVSILPISPEPAVEEVDPANVIIGKTAEQIEKMANQAIIDGRIEL